MLAASVAPDVESTVDGPPALALEAPAGGRKMDGETRTRLRISSWLPSGRPLACRGSKTPPFEWFLLPTNAERNSLERMPAGVIGNRKNGRVIVSLDYSVILCAYHTYVTNDAQYLERFFRKLSINETDCAWGKTYRLSQRLRFSMPRNRPSAWA